VDSSIHQNPFIADNDPEILGPYDPGPRFPAEHVAAVQALLDGTRKPKARRRVSP
jgi:hypothetical protein